MRLRESRATLNASLTTIVALDSRSQIVRYIAEWLGMRGLDVNDSMVHFEPCGINPHTGWDEYRVTVDGFGVFGFTDGPCPRGLPGMPIWPLQERIFPAEIETAFDVPYV
jgi:hypothetical protein